MGTVRMATRDVNTALGIRRRLETPLNYINYDLIRGKAIDLQNGYLFFVKYDNGNNLSMAFDNQIDSLAITLAKSFEEIGTIVDTIAAYCVSHEKVNGLGEWEFERRLEGTSLYLLDLVKLSREEGCYLIEPTNPKALQLIDELVRFQAIQQALKSHPVSLVHDGRPLVGLAVDKPKMIAGLHRAGYTVEQLEGVVAFWKDGLIEPQPVIENNVLTVNNLMQAAKNADVI